MLEEIKNIDSSKKELKKFGLSVGFVLLLIGAVLFYYGETSAVYFAGTGAVLMLAGLLIPKVLKPLHKGWMALAIMLGIFSTKVILSLLFYLMITPIALIAKLAGRDFLDEKIDKNAETYWSRRERQEYKKENSEKQF